MGITDSSDVQNIKQQKMNKTGKLTDGETRSLKVRLHFSKYQVCIDIQSEHNYVILSGVTIYQLHVSATLLGHYQVVLNLQSNCITYRCIHTYLIL